MTSRGRHSTNEWDLMREDFNSSTYDPQYPDDDASGGVQLDHCRLYIRNIPKALNDEGLRTAFSKYGTLLEVFVSRDPLKKYALVRYETPGEAKLAMTKLNNTDPLKLNITIAHKNKRDSSSRDSFTNGPRRSTRDDNASVSSRDKSYSHRRQEDLTNGDEMDEPPLPPVDDDMDPDTKMKGLQLELQRLQVQEQTVLLRQQMLQLEAARKKNVSLTQTTASNRCILPDGRIVVRNVNDRNLESRDVEGSFAAGAGDSLTIPALQRVASHACVACGAPADSYCARCGVTPYCSPRCQRRDWAERHRAVCHNLARLSAKSEAVEQTVEDQEVLPPPAPLRRPHSPKREPQRNDDAGSDKGQKYPQAKKSPAQNNKAGGSNFNHGPRNFNKPGDRPQGERPYGNKPQGDRPEHPQAKKSPAQNNKAGGSNFNHGSRNFNKPSGDRPQGERPYGNKPHGDRPEYPQAKKSPAQNNKAGGSNFNDGPRNFNKPGDRPQGERPYGNKPQGDRPEVERPQENRSGGERPQNNRPHDRPQYRPQEDKPGFKPQGQRPPLRHENKDDGESFERNNKPTSAPMSAPAPKPAEQPKPSPSAEQPKHGPSAEQPKPKVNGFKAPGSLSDAMPGRKIVPKNYLIELLKLGDTALLSVESNASECRTKRGGHVCLSVHEAYEADYQQLCEQYTVDCEADSSECKVPLDPPECRSKRSGHVCLSVHEAYEADYQQLCEQYTVDCEADGSECKPNIGETFSYLNPADGGWYRARLLTPKLAALVDSGKVVTITSTDKLKPLPAKYERPPEFCCLLNAPSVEVGHNLKCTLVSKTADGFKVTLENVETNAPAGEGEISRWLPEVEHPAPAAPVNNVPAVAQIPEIPRPDVVNNSTVLLVDATSLDRAFVRPSDAAAQRQYDTVLQDAVLYGRSATPLKEPPQKGQVVIAKFDDLHYRALVKRTSVKQNKYLLEYVEFGNVEVTQLENIYPCPPNLDLSAQPALASLVTFQCKDQSTPFTPPALEYLDKLKDGAVELTLTIPSGAKTAASGSAVNLTVVKSKESVNRRLEEMCTPEWKKMEENGGDVVDTQPLMYSDLEYQELPAGGCTLDILDISGLTEGSVSACRQGTHDLNRLTEQMAAYCNSEIGKMPYLPKHEELCIAKCEPYPQWFRAVLLEQTPGSASARVCYIDYGNVAEVPVEHLRKMLPEFVRGLPALASHLEVKGFPPSPTAEQLGRAIEHMQINDDGRGVLTVTKCEKQEGGLYVVHAPELIKALRV